MRGSTDPVASSQRSREVHAPPSGRLRAVIGHAPAVGAALIASAVSVGLFALAIWFGELQLGHEPAAVASLARSFPHVHGSWNPSLALLERWVPDMYVDRGESELEGLIRAAAGPETASDDEG